MLSFVSNYIVLGGIAAQAGYVCGQLMDNSPLGTREFMFSWACCCHFQYGKWHCHVVCAFSGCARVWLDATALKD